MVSSTGRSAGTRNAGPSRDQRRSVAAAKRAEAARRDAQRRRVILGGGMALAILAVAAAAVTLLGLGGNEPSAEDSARAAPFVGGDLHTVASVGDALYVGGHDAVAVSRDGGRRWKEVPSLSGADAMGWAVTPDAVLVGGHPGMFRSTDGGTTFARVSGPAAAPDVHALGGTGSSLYLASPQLGLMASTDGGQTWQVRSAQEGRSFMGTILVDPKDPNRLIGVDMAAGLTASADGGRTWKPLGGPQAAMAAAWSPANTDDIIAVGMNGGARSTDGGATWQELRLPAGTSAVSYDTNGQTLYAAALNGQRAVVYRSTDNGAAWVPTIGPREARDGVAK